MVRYLVWRAEHAEATTAAHAASNAHAKRLREGVLAPYGEASGIALAPKPMPKLRKRSDWNIFMA